MIVKLLTEHHLEFLSLKGGCRGSSESTLVKISNCWKSHAAAHSYTLALLFFAQFCWYSNGRGHNGCLLFVCQYRLLITFAIRLDPEFKTSGLASVETLIVFLK